MSDLFNQDKPLFKFDKNKKIRFISLFSGIGFQELGLKYLGVDFDYHRAIEFDKYACQAYNLVHNQNIVPTDICSVKGKDLDVTETDKYEYLLTYSFPCFTGDTLILTNKGLKCIKDIEIGDKVLSHDNLYHSVVAFRKTGVKNIIELKGMSVDKIECTENHKFYVREMYRKYPTFANGKRGKERHFYEPKWVECKDLSKKHYLGVAINQNSIIPEWNGIEFVWHDNRKNRLKNELSDLMDNKNFWWVIGRYIGDGWQRTQGGIIICCAKDKLNEITPYLKECDFNYSVVEDRTVKKIHIPLKELGLFCSQFGKGAGNKFIPSFMFDMPVDLLDSFIKGYLSSDGWISNDGIYKISSISKNLIYGTAQLVAKVYKTPYRIYHTKRSSKVVIEGRLCNQKDSYELVWKVDKRKQDRAFYEDGYIWTPIKSIIDTRVEKEVYDIEVEKSHSFTANGIIAHNCTDLSGAGAQKGMSKGSGTRSGLLWEVERLLNECEELSEKDSRYGMPKVLVMENVAAIHQKKFIKDFNMWIDYLESKGYSNYWQDMNSLDYGIPQSRNRTYMVSILGDYRFDFPKPVPLTRNLEDMLIPEEEVAPKFYFNSEKTEKLIQDMIDKKELPYAENSDSNK